MDTQKTYTVINSFFGRNGKWIIIFAILLYIFAFCLISYLKYNSFSYYDVDLSTIERTFWNTIHGKFVAHNVGDITIFNGGHLFLIIFLLVPLYAICPHPLTLLFLQTIFLALPAYFIFRFARDKIDASFATYFALSYLLYPALAYVNLFETHLIAFAPFFLLPMFIFFDQRKFWPFVLFMLLSLACKEDVSLVIFGLGLYGLFKYTHLKPPFIQRKDWKWIIIPLLSGLLWFVLATKFIQPYFTPSELKDLSGPRGIFIFYEWLGKTPGEIVRTLFFHPGVMLQGIFIPMKNIYLAQLFGPLAFLSVFGFREIIIVLFALSESLLSQQPTHFLIFYQYPALVTPFIFISAIFGLRRLLQVRIFKQIRLYILVGLFSISVFSAFKIGPLFKVSFADWRRDKRDVLKERFVDLVPQEGRVAASFELCTRLTHRDRLFPTHSVNIAYGSAQFAYITEKLGEESSYMLIDFLDNLTYFGFYFQDSDIYLKDFLERFNWSVAYEIDNITLWTKVEDNPKQLIETIENFPAQLSKSSLENEYIRLEACQVKGQVVLDQPVLHLDAYLECETETEQRYILQLDFYSKGHKELLKRHYFIAPDRIYPTKRWKKGEKIRISQNVSVPTWFQIEDYDLVLSFCLVE